jgi:hypothetical protein
MRGSPYTLKRLKNQKTAKVAYAGLITKGLESQGEREKKLRARKKA